MQYSTEPFRTEDLNAIDEADAIVALVYHVMPVAAGALLIVCVCAALHFVGVI